MGERGAINLLDVPVGQWADALSRCLNTPRHHNWHKNIVACIFPSCLQASLFQLRQQTSLLAFLHANSHHMHGPWLIAPLAWVDEHDGPVGPSRFQGQGQLTMGLSCVNSCPPSSYIRKLLLYGSCTVNLNGIGPNEI